MDFLSNDKIQQYLRNQAQLITLDEHTPLNPSNSTFSLLKKNDTKNLTGVKLKLAEFHNTLLKIFYDKYSIANNRKATLQSLKDHYINYFKDFDRNINKQTFEEPSRYFIDITFSMQQKSITGIPRVVRELVKYGIDLGLTPVFIEANNLYFFDQSKQEFSPVVFSKNDYLILPDAGWNYLEDLCLIQNKLKKCGGNTIILLYDLIPFMYPILSSSSHVNAFNYWMHKVVFQSDYVLCISKSVYNELLLLITSKQADANSIQAIGWAHLGCDFTESQSNNLTDVINKFVEKHNTYFLSVGTLEPRKGYSISLDAMEILWNKGVNVSYVIVGKYGWSQSHVRTRILNHPEYGLRLFWFESATDSDLNVLYKNSLALVSSSICEGFGLPLIEAAHHKLPAIVSDIPVFREIGGHSTKFFEVTNSKMLAQCLLDAVESSKVVPDISFLTWEKSVKRILSIIKNGEYNYNSKHINTS